MKSIFTKMPLPQSKSGYSPLCLISTHFMSTCKGQTSLILSTQCRTTRHYHLIQKFCSHTPLDFSKMSIPFRLPPFPIPTRSASFYLHVLLSLILSILGISPHYTTNTPHWASLYLFTSPYLHLHRLRKPTYFLTHTWKGHSPGLLLSFFSFSMVIIQNLGALNLDIWPTFLLGMPHL